MSGPFGTYASYKASDVERIGDIPVHWNIIPLKGRCQIVNGSTPKSDVSAYWDGAIAWVTPADLSKLGSPYVESGGRSISAAGYDSCGTQLVPPGSVILSSRAPIGTVAIADREMCTNQGCKSLVVRKNLDSKYLYYVLAISSGPLNVLGRGATFLELSSDELGRFQVACPEKEEQAEIAKFLDYETAKIDALVEKQQQLIALLKEKRQAVISHAVTKGLNPDAPMRDSGVEWLGEVPAHWETSRIAWACPYLSYGFTNPMPTTDEGPYMLTAADISFDGIQYNSARHTARADFLALSGKSRPQVGDLLVTKDATLGRVTVYRGEHEVCISQSVALLRPDTRKVSPDFLAVALSGADYQSKLAFDAGGTTIKHIYISILAKMNVWLPGLAEQNEIVTELAGRCQKLDELVQAATSAAELLQERRSALISAAVTGKIDVRGWKPPESEPEAEVS